MSLKFNLLPLRGADPDDGDRIVIYPAAGFAVADSLAADDQAAANPPKTISWAALRGLLARPTGLAINDGILTLTLSDDSTVAVALPVNEDDHHHPIALSRAMPAELAELAAASEGGSAGIWLVAADQDAGDNTAGVMIRAGGAGIADAGGEEISTDAVDAATVRLAAGTVVQIASATEARVISGPPVGGSAGRFSLLADTPDALGAAGQIVAVNAAGDGLEFVAAPDDGITEQRAVMVVQEALTSSEREIAWSYESNVFTITPSTAAAERQVDSPTFALVAAEVAAANLTMTVHLELDIEERSGFAPVTNIQLLRADGAQMIAEVTEIDSGIFTHQFHLSASSGQIAQANYSFRAVSSTSGIRARIRVNWNKVTIARVGAAVDEVDNLIVKTLDRNTHQLLPPGGATGDWLAKRSAKDRDAGWSSAFTSAMEAEVNRLVNARLTAMGVITARDNVLVAEARARATLELTGPGTPLTIEAIESGPAGNSRTLAYRRLGVGTNITVSVTGDDTFIDIPSGVSTVAAPALIAAISTGLQNAGLRVAEPRPDWTITIHDLNSINQNTVQFAGGADDDRIALADAAGKQMEWAGGNVIVPSVSSLTKRVLGQLVSISTSSNPVTLVSTGIVIDTESPYLIISSYNSRYVISGPFWILTTDLFARNRAEAGDEALSGNTIKKTVSGFTFQYFGLTASSELLFGSSPYSGSRRNFMVCELI